MRIQNPKYVLVAMAGVIVGILWSAISWHAKPYAAIAQQKPQQNVTLAVEEPAKKEEQEAIRCVVIGGMMQSDFFRSVADRFEEKTGRSVFIEYSGPKDLIALRFIENDADLITMHSSDTIINLVAHGFAADPQPWARNDMVLVGPPSDPAGIKGEKSAAKAMAKIIKSGSKYMVHASQGTSEVLHALLLDAELDLDPEKTISLPVDRHRQFLEKLSRKKPTLLWAASLSSTPNCRKRAPRSWFKGTRDSGGLTWRR